MDLLYYIMEDLGNIMSILLQAVDLYPYGADLERGRDLSTKSRFKIRRDDLTQRVDLTLRVDYIRIVDLKESI